MSRTPGLWIVLGFMPNEVRGDAIAEMQGLNKKMYNQFVPMLVDSFPLYRFMACCLLVRQS